MNVVARLLTAHRGRSVRASPRILLHPLGNGAAHRTSRGDASINSIRCLSCEAHSHPIMLQEVLAVDRANGGLPRGNCRPNNRVIRHAAGLVTSPIPPLSLPMEFTPTSGTLVTGSRFPQLRSAILLTAITAAVRLTREASQTHEEHRQARLVSTLPYQHDVFRRGLACRGLTAMMVATHYFHAASLHLFLPSPARDDSCCLQ